MSYKLFFLKMFFILATSSLFAQGLSDRDGNHYTIAKIGNQEWIVENLDVTHFRNGDSIPEAETITEWESAGRDAKPAWCYYNGDSVLGKKYHRLYNWYAVIDPRGLAPSGWHIPATEDWLKLASKLGNENVAATKMKSATLWNGTNESGFTALAAGYRNSRWEFAHMGKLASFWSATETDDRNAWSYSIGAGSVLSRSYDNKMVGLSVRCIRD